MSFLLTSSQRTSPALNDSTLDSDAGPEYSDALPEDFQYARRDEYWRAQIATLLGSSDGADVLGLLANGAAGARIALVPFGGAMPSGGHLAAGLLLHRICHSQRIVNPPCRLVVLPDNVASRSGYGALKISVRDLESLMDAWRLRAAAAGSAGDYLPVEKALRARRRRRDGDLLPPDAETLHLFFPAFRPGPDGELKPIASRHHLGAGDRDDPPVVFTDSVALADRRGVTLLTPPDYFVIECRGAVGELDIEYFDALVRLWPQSRFVWLLPDLGHPLFNRLFGRGTKICWFPLTDVGATASSVIGAGTPVLSIRWQPVGSTRERSDLESLLQLLLGARREARALKRPEAWLAFGLLKAATVNLTTLPVPRKHYDDAAVEHFRVFTTEELLSELANRELRVAAIMPSLAALMEEAHSILLGMLATLTDESKRSRHIVDAVEAAIGSGDGICVVVRSHAMRAAMETFLTTALDTDLGDLGSTGVRIETTADLGPASAGALPPLLWAGYSGGRDLDLILRYQRRGVTILLGPLERQMICEDLDRWLRRASVAQQGSEAFGVTTATTVRAIGQLGAFLTDLRSVGYFRSSEGTALNLEELFEEEAMPSQGTGRAAQGEAGSVLRPAFQVRFVEPGAKAYFPEHGLLTVLRAGKTEPAELTVSELQPGDRVVFVDRTVGRTLYELMQDQLVHSPIVGPAAQMVRLWHRTLAEGYRRSGFTFDELLARLRLAGSEITSYQTVRSWVRGGVLGPQDLGNIDRIAAILGIGRKDGRIMEEVKHSIRGLRRVHRGFARIVYRSILTAGAGGQLSDAEETLLEEHGLQLKDLREAVSILTVSKVAGAAEMVPVSDVGIQVEE